MGKNKDAVIAYFTACNNHDADAIADMYAPDGVHIVTGKLPISGVHTREQMRGLSKGIMDAFPDGMTFTVTDIAEEDDTVYCQVDSSGKHISGVSYDQHYAWVFKFANGLVKSSKEYYDTVHAADVLLGDQRNG